MVSAATSTPAEKSAGQTSFDQQLQESLSGPAAPSTQKQASDQVTPESLGLPAAAGSVATINGVTFYGTDSGWTQTAPAVAVQPGDPTGEELLGFQPQWVDKVPSLWLNEDGLPAGIVYLNTKHFATTETAQKLASLLGATAVPIEHSRGGANGEVPQWELDFGDGKRLNAGLVADMFLRDPMRAFERLRAETA